MYTAAVLLTVALCLLPLSRATPSSSCACSDVTDLLKSQVHLLSEIYKADDDTQELPCYNFTNRLDKIEEFFRRGSE